MPDGQPAMTPDAPLLLVQIRITAVVRISGVRRGDSGGAISLRRPNLSETCPARSDAGEGDIPFPRQLGPSSAANLWDKLIKSSLQSWAPENL